MTARTAHLSPAVSPTAFRLSPARVRLRALGLAATLPYLALKAAWLAGSRIGIPEGSVLREPGPFFLIANAVTMLMDATLVLLLLVLTTSWGTRVRSWLLTVPVFLASGLLTPIAIAFPAQLVTRIGDGGAAERAHRAAEPFLDEWVFTVVYVGFGIQALVLACLFVPYARERWGGLWRGAPWAAGRVERAAAALATATGLAVAALLGSWTFGGTAGLSAAAEQAHKSVETAVVSGTHALTALAAVAGGLLLVHAPRWGIRAARLPLAVAWIGASASLGWGGWLMIAALGAGDPAKDVTYVMYLTYAGQMITGLLVAGVLTRRLTARGLTARRPTVRRAA
ncbi:hypothetical protein [Streptomyces sp. NPDC093225]|uniref:hypothetical protein n=1 Tax=Streptomyces sp. NPDC093225 TaxID=3366034 RepID=UPI00380CCD02